MTRRVKIEKRPAKGAFFIDSSRAFGAILAPEITSNTIYETHRNPYRSAIRGTDSGERTTGILRN